MSDDFKAQMRVLTLIAVLLAVITLLVIMCGCGCVASNEMKSLSDNYTSMRADLTTHMQMATRIEGDVSAVKNSLTTQVSAGGNIQYSDFWLTIVFGIVGGLYVVANEFRDWRRRRNGHGRR